MSHESSTPPNDFDYGLGDQQTVQTRAQWHNGNRLLKPIGGVAYTGGLIIEAKHLPDNVEIVGFGKTMLTLNRNEIPVYASANTEIAILARRLRYFTGTGESRKNFSQSQYEDAVAQGFQLRGNLQLACYLKGLPDRPIYISLTGTASRGIIAQIKQFEKEALPITTKRMNETTESTMPLHAFWLTLSPSDFKLEGKSGKQSEVTPPTFNFPPTFNREYLLQRYIGAQLLQTFNEEREELLEWASAWNVIGDNEDESSEIAEPEFRQAA